MNSTAATIVKGERGGVPHIAHCSDISSGKATAYSVCCSIFESRSHDCPGHIRAGKENLVLACDAFNTIELSSAVQDQVSLYQAYLVKQSFHILYIKFSLLWDEQWQLLFLSLWQLENYYAG